MEICALSGGVITTLTDENATRGGGSIDWDTNLPQDNGIYTYTITAEHNLTEGQGPPGLCVDTDKSSQLEISDVDLNDLLFDSRELTLSGELCYTLNRDAGAARLRVFDPDLDLVGTEEGLPATSGEHTYEFFFDVNADPVTPYWFVVDAQETIADGEQNRDGEPKPALAKGGGLSLPIRAYNFTGALNYDAGQIINWAVAQQAHAPEGEFYPPPAYSATKHTQTWDVKTTYKRLADHDLDGNHNPVADACVFYIGHGAPGVMLIGDREEDAHKEIWTGQGADHDWWDCFYMGNPRFGANALRRALVAVIAACESADDRPADWPNGPRESVMDGFHNQGAGCAIGYHGMLWEPVAQAFCNTFWELACSQNDGDGDHEVTIEEAFYQAEQACGSDAWDLVGGGAAERLRPAKYRGDGQ